MRPLGLLEELALERSAQRELEAEAGQLWALGRYAAAREAKADAMAAQARVSELEREQADG
jgi:hypothetical protein